ncbi:MAG TPA: sugar phosphate isomerase/epimerase [Flavobacterium sp.]|uniref:sugar phosphate isomerase/epimerase family protein n=1 Tax=Flavobacterium sp. TaxID=239 RepID=UPI002DBB7C95|nr:sugar phosphate isomerase/epimerase [Flavobacterium sp.]HEU4788072.1 sugar phosphate isomerase/epimerase [Flavobacterium sp.]
MSQNRRSFIKTTASAAAAMMLPSLEQLKAETKPSFTQNSNFKLLIMATNWGYEGSIEEFCAAAKKDGYDGVEVLWSSDAKEQQQLFEALKKHQLQVGLMCIIWESDWQKHFTEFCSNLDAILSNPYQKPLYVNCHSGRDYYSYDENKAFLDYTFKKSKETGILICHETHRSRMLFAAHITKQFIEKNPDLKLTFDVSHWCNVHESLLYDQEETVNLALKNVEHIHARIGHSQGPQVNDPRAPEWSETVKRHFEWWDKIIERKKQKGEVMTILTEFGPPDYMPTLPYTRQPIADQWDINVYMMQLLRKRYQNNS